MSFDPLRKHPGIKRASPWVVWGAVLVFVALFMPHTGTVGLTPAAAEVRQATVTAPRTARVKHIAVLPGDAVKQGDVLVELDTASVDFELAIANAELARTKAGALAREVDLKGSDLDSAARLNQEAEAATVGLAALSSEEKRDRAELSQVDELLAKQDKLVEQKLASAEQRDALKLRRASLAQRVAEYASLLKAASDHETATRDRLRSWRTAHEKDEKGGLPLQERVAPALAEVAAQEERVRQLDNLRQTLSLKAPISGTVSQLLVTEGDTARQDAPVLEIVDDHPMRVIAWVDERKSAQIQLHERVDLRASDRSGMRRTGQVTAVAPSIAELPQRFRPVPTQASFGRAVYIALDAPAAGDTRSPLPGQAFDAVFTGEIAKRAP